jgi:uncharacterized ferredoxin-like protein
MSNNMQRSKLRRKSAQLAENVKQYAEIIKANEDQKEKHIESMQRMKMSDNMQRLKLIRKSALHKTRSDQVVTVGFASDRSRVGIDCGATKGELNYMLFQSRNQSRPSDYKRRIVGGLVNDQIKSGPLDTQAPDQRQG